jgi:CPA2 family monovalent cation:H+ antiporter-2
MHDLTVITMLTGALAAALALGWMTQRLGLSSLVGYLLAGIAVGPHTPGFVADVGLAAQLAEIGVILLMFGVGLHFHPRDLLRVWRIAVPGAVAQSAAATLFGWVIAMAFGWPPRGGLILGMALAVASTVVLMRMLDEQGRLATREGHVAVGWLIVEDVFTVIALVVLPALAAASTGAGATAIEVALAVGKAAAFAALIWLLGPRLLSPLLEHLARRRAAELFTLGVFVLALSIASVAAEVFHVSVALGAFFGGLVVAQSRVGHQAAADMLPFRDVFSALFFVSIGMLFEPAFVADNVGLILAALGVVLLVKPLVALLLVLALRGTAATAATVSVGLAQIGEFSFILGALGKQTGLLPEAGFHLLIATALISIAVNPLLFRLAPAIERAVGSLSRRRPASVAASTPAAGAASAGPSILLVGYGRTGSKIAASLGSSFGTIAVIDRDLDAIDAATGDGYNTCHGSGGNDQVLVAAGIGSATTLVVATPTLAEKMRICLAARRLNPAIRLITFADGDSEAAWLNEFGVDELIELRSEVAHFVRRRI